MKKTKISENEAIKTPKISKGSEFFDGSKDQNPEIVQEDISNSTIQDELTKQVAELTNDLQRTRADFENFRKQVELQRSQAALVAKQSTVSKFLPLIDDFERAFASFPEQLAPLEKNFSKTLGNLGLEKIDSNENVEFSPSLHEAVSVADDDGDVEVVAETLRPGYFYEGEILRPAMVKVKHIPAK